MRLDNEVVVKQNKSKGSIKGAVPLMFDTISESYDSLNHFLSFGIDRIWRKKLVSLIKAKKGDIVVDIATGTADIPLLLKDSDVVVFAIDPSVQMLERASEKISERKLQQKISLIEAPAEMIPLKSNLADYVSVSFGIRNFSDLQKGLAEIHRIIKPEGTCLIMEFTLPENTVLRNAYVFYLTSLLPLIGGLFSGNTKAYRYLHKTIVKFARNCDVRNELQNAGFSRIHKISLTLGVVSIYVAVK